MDDPWKRPALATAVFYKNPKAALDWLEQALGFERTMVITDADENLVHSEMAFDGGLIMIGAEWADYTASPASVGGKNTQMIHVHIKTDVDAHFEAAKAAGGVVVREPTDEFYGDRGYSVRDPEGHVWSVSQTKAYVSREDAEKASGLKIEGWADR